MVKKLLIILMVCMGVALVVPSVWAVDCYPDVATWNTGTQAGSIVGYYSTPAAAVAAAVAYAAPAGDCWYISAQNTFALDGVADAGYPVPSCTGWVYAFVYASSTPSCKWGDIAPSLFFCAPASGDLPIDCFPPIDADLDQVDDNVDSDGDGLPDLYDAYPDVDNSSDHWQKNVTYNDGNGNEAGYQIQYQSTGEIQHLGNAAFVDDLPSMDGSGNIPGYTMTFNVNYPPYDKDWQDMIDLFCGAMSLPPPAYPPAEPAIPMPEYNDDGTLKTDPPELESSERSETGDTSDDLLRKIADNTGKTVDNQDDQSGQFERIAKGIEEALKGLAGGKWVVNVPPGDGSGEGEYGGPTAGEIGDAVGTSVGSELDSRIDAGKTASESKASGYDSTVKNYDFSTSIQGQDGYVADDLPAGDALPGSNDGSFISDIFDNFLANSPVAGLLDGSGIDLSGASCTFDCNYDLMGQSGNVEFSFCEYQSFLNSLGVFVFGISGIVSIMIIFRG